MDFWLLTTIFDDLAPVVSQLGLSNFLVLYFVFRISRQIYTLTKNQAAIKKMVSARMSKLNTTLFTLKSVIEMRPCIYPNRQQITNLFDQLVTEEVEDFEEDDEEDGSDGQLI